MTPIFSLLTALLLALLAALHATDSDYIKAYLRPELK